MRVQRVEVVQSWVLGRVVYGWLCSCGAGGGPYESHANAVTLGRDHELRHARRRDLLVERFGPVPA